MGEARKKSATGNNGLAMVVSWVVIVAGALAVLTSGGRMLVAMSADGGLALLLDGPRLLYGIGSIYVAWQLLKRLGN